MIQIIEESFPNIEKAKEYSNKMGLLYKDIKDIKDINIVYSNENKYIVVLKLEIEEGYIAFTTFDLIKLKKKKVDAENIKYIWEVDYDIEFQDKRLKESGAFNALSLISRCDLYRNNYSYFYELTAHFGFKDWITLIEIKIEAVNLYEIILRAFNHNEGYRAFGMSNCEKEHFYRKN